MVFPLPTITLIEGHAFAGGLILSLCHDLRVIVDGKHKICLSTMNMGFPIPSGYSDIIRSNLNPNTFRNLYYGKRFSPSDTYKMGIVN